MEVPKLKLKLNFELMQLLLIMQTITSLAKNSCFYKNNVSFNNCISKINGIENDNAEDLDVVMPMYNYLNIVKIIKKQQVVYGIIIEMNQIVRKTIIK